MFRLRIRFTIYDFNYRMIEAVGESFHYSINCVLEGGGEGKERRGVAEVMGTWGDGVTHEDEVKERLKINDFGFP